LQPMRTVSNLDERRFPTRVGRWAPGRLLGRGSPAKPDRRRAGNVCRDQLRAWGTSTNCHASETCLKCIPP